MSEQIRNYINELYLSGKITPEEHTKLHEMVTLTVCNVLDECYKELDNLTK